MDIKQRTLKIISEKISSKSILLDMELDSLNINSITFIEIIVSLETEFDFEFDDEMLLFAKFPTVKSMVEYVESKVTTNRENG